MKKNYTFLLCLTILLNTGLKVQAQTEIRTAEEFAALNDDKTSLSGNYILMNDLTLNDWIPVGNTEGKDGQGFSGTFDGNGHTITIIDFSSSFDKPTIGLFSMIEKEGIVKNLCVAGNVSYEGNQQFLYIGGIAGFNFGLITCCVSKIEMEGSVNTASGTKEKIKGLLNDDNGAFGGCIVGINRGAITNCYSTGMVSILGNKPSVFAGGIAGRNGIAPKGGLGISIGSGGVGMTVNQAVVTTSDRIINCYSTASVFSEKIKSSNKLEFVSSGGIAAHNYATGIIANCVALNEVIGTKSIKVKPHSMPVPLLSVHNNFYSKDIVYRAYKNGQEQKPNKYSTNKKATVFSETQEESWWQHPEGLTEKQRVQKFGFSFGNDEQSPWVWSDEVKRPVLYWEKTRQNGYN